ncbi:alpha/beta hydrolase [Priestia megaterium]
MQKKVRFLRILRNMIVAMLGVCIIWVVTNRVITAVEKKKYPPIGQLVEVNGRDIHVYTKGKGENTIVLLSGLGTTAPALDFEPLVNELSKDNKVVVVEPFGYGWSDITNKKRTVENSVSEMREALQKSNIKGPYILMPHSVSGVYSMYYANKYPDEVKAVIGIDPTLPKALDYFKEEAPNIPSLMSVLAPSGLARLALLTSPNQYLPLAEEGTYTTKNLKMTKAISSWKGYNKNVIDEAKELNNNINKTVDMSFPSKTPVMIFARKVNKEPKEGKSNITFYQNQLSHVSSQKLVVLQGHHYLRFTRTSLFTLDEVQRNERICE